MKRVNIILGACGLIILAYSLPSWAQVRQQTQTTTLSGTVESIDQSQRIVHIKTDDGKFETIDVPKTAKRFDELKVVHKHPPFSTVREQYKEDGMRVAARPICSGDDR